jgi:outer membrane lipopolysaccharide assembly protein LptE/RlpB
MKIKQIFALRAAVLALFLTAACGNDLNTAQGIAEEFVDHHYVKIDLQKAKQYTVSVAQAKIDEEIRLTGGQTIDASTQKPRVNYTLLEKKEGDQRSTYLFEGKIQSEDGTSFTRKWSIATRKEGNDWRVSNFTESD